MTGGQFELGISVLNRHRGGGGVLEEEGVGGSGVHRPPQSLEQRDLCKGGTLQYAISITF